MSEQDKLQAILNLACVVMARRSTPAAREHAEALLLGLAVEEEARPWEFAIDPNGKTWFQIAKEACPNWREI